MSRSGPCKLFADESKSKLFFRLVNLRGLQSRRWWHWHLNFRSNNMTCTNKVHKVQKLPYGQIEKLSLWNLTIGQLDYIYKLYKYFLKMKQVDSQNLVEIWPIWVKSSIVNKALYKATLNSSKFKKIFICIYKKFFYKKIELTISFKHDLSADS